MCTVSVISVISLPLTVTLCAVSAGVGEPAGAGLLPGRPLAAEAPLGSHVGTCSGGGCGGLHWLIGLWVVYSGGLARLTCAVAVF